MPEGRAEVEVEAQVEAKTRRERVLDDRPACDFDQTPPDDDGSSAAEEEGRVRNEERGVRRQEQSERQAGVRATAGACIRR